MQAIQAVSQSRNATLDVTGALIWTGERFSQFIEGPAASVAALRQSGKVVYPEDIGIRRSDATRSLLAAGSVAELVEWSDGLYNPPAKFRSW